MQVAVQDQRGFTPFTVATYRGHFELASIILEIAEAQYLPVAQVPRRFEREKYRVIANVDSDGDDISDSNSSHSSDVRIEVEYQLADEHFTVHDIREAANNAKSTVSPSTLITHKSRLGLFLNDVKSLITKRVIDQSSGLFGCPSTWVSAHFHLLNIYINWY